MPMYRANRSLEGSYTVHRTSADEEVGRAVGSAAGWALGAGVDLAGAAVRGIRDRRMLKAVKAMMEADARGDEDVFLALTTDFTRRYPREEFGHEQRAKALLAKGRHDESISELDRAIELGFDEWDGRFARAHVLSDAGNNGAALQEFTQLLDNSKYRAHGYMGRAMCLAELGDLDQALDDATAAVAALPGEESYQVRAVVHRLRGDSERALKDIDRVLQLSPDDEDYLQFRAELHDNMGDVGAARQDRDRASAVAGLTTIVNKMDADVPAAGDAEMRPSGISGSSRSLESLRASDPTPRNPRHEGLVIAICTVLVIAIAGVISYVVSTQSSSPATANTVAPPSPAGPATDSGAALPESAALTGTWEGSYICSQGETGLRLHMIANPGGLLQAEFEFFPLPSNPSVASGRFVMSGSYSADGLLLDGERWIDQPSGFSMVDLRATMPIGSDGSLVGAIDTSGCETFSVRRT